MSFLPTRWRDFFRSVPGYALVLTVALLTAVAAELLCLVIGDRVSTIFWDEFGKGDFVLGDRLEAWASFFLLLFTPFLLRFCARLPWRSLARWLEKNLALVVVLSALFYAVLLHYVARDLPYTPDEACAVLQARTFGAFHITPQVSPDLARLVIPKWIQDDFVIFSAQSGRYIPTYWPGFALLMAPLAHFGLEWLFNPIVTALSLLVAFHLVRRLTGTSEGGLWALVFMLSASQIALNAATYFSMPAHLLFNLLFCYLITSDTRKTAFAAGVLGGYALVLHNPVPHFSFALPWIIWVGLKRRNHLLPLLAGYCLLFLPIGIGWSAHLQSFDAGKYVKAAQATHQSGGFQRFAEVASRVAYVIRPPDRYLLLSRAAGLCKFIVWGTPGAAGLALLGWQRLRRLRRNTTELPASETATTTLPVSPFRNDYLWLFGVSLVLNFVLYLFVRFDQGHGWGFRYLHQSWMVLAVLPAFFLVHANSLWKRFAAVFCLCGLLVIVPMRIVQLNALTSFIFEAGPPALSNPQTPTITFINDIDEQASFIQNDPFLRGTNWQLRFTTPAGNAVIARRYLTNARHVQSGKWGERWIGDSFTHSGSPFY